MTPTSRPDQFEEDLRQALIQEAGGPAPERLAARLAAMRQQVPSRSPLERLAGWLGPRSRPALALGLGLVAVLVAGLATGPLLHGFGTAPAGPQRSTTAPTAATSATAPASSPSSGPTSLASPSPATSARSSASTSDSGPAGGAVPAGFKPVSLTFVSASRGWLLGSAPCGSTTCSAIVRTTDGGRSWASIPAPAAGVASGPAAGVGSSGVSRLRFADPLDGWAFGPDLWATHDGGATWHRISLPGGGASVTALETSAGLVHAAFYLVASASEIRLATSPSGSDSWTVSSIRPQLGAGPVPQTQLVLHGTAAWLVQVDRTVVSGAELVSGAWRAWQPPCLDAAGPASLAAASTTDLVAACDVGLWATPQGRHLFSSVDGGATFKEAAATIPTLDLQGITAAPASRTVVVAGNLSSGGAGLVASFDGGASWSTVYGPQAAASIADLGFTTATQGVAIVSSTGGSQLVITRDGGHTWAAVDVVGP